MKYLWESDIQEAVVFKPIVRGKKGRKKMKKANAAIYIPNMDADNFDKICNEKGLQFVYFEVPPHGRLIDADAIRADINEKRPRRSYEDAWALTVIDAAPTIIEAEEGEI